MVRAIVGAGGKSRPDHPLAQSGILHCELMSSAVNDELSVEKVGCQLAAAIEEAFIDANWPSGELFGTEEQLCQLYGVSHRIYREAVRILTMRGTVHVRRGPHPGLVIADPDPDAIADIISGYTFLLRVSEQHKDEARRFVERTRQRLDAHGGTETENIVLQFLSNFIENTFNPGAPPKGLLSSKFRKTRAGQIALKVLEEYVWALSRPGTRVASEQQLSERYCADRSITRQAIRLLEHSGVITSFPGRGNGLFTQEPPAGPVCRLLCCYFAANKLPKSLSFLLFETMSIEMVALAAETVGAEPLDRCQILLDRLAGAGPITMVDMLAVEDSFASVLNNPFISLIFKSVRGYIAPMIARETQYLPGEIGSYYLESSQKILRAIRNGDTAGAAAAQVEKLSHMRELERLNNPWLSEQLHH